MATNTKCLQWCIISTVSMTSCVIDSKRYADANPYGTTTHSTRNDESLSKRRDTASSC